jgi:ribonucleoside-diphosphate reductase alpha chain
MNGPTLPISEEVHSQKYRGEGESFEEAMIRVAGALADDEQHFTKFLNILMDMRDMPAGRVQAAMGSPKRITPYNCFVSQTIFDSMDSIMDALRNAAETMRLGGGIGYDFSRLRPEGDRIVSLGSTSSGPVSFMDIFDSLCKTIMSAGHRRGAMMGVLRVDHPDIEKFIRAKQTLGRLTQFNISVGITDEFMQAVIKGDGFDLKFEGRVYQRIDAAMLWEEIMRSTWNYAEPGVLFLDRINEYNNLYYCEELEATNPCVSGDTEILTKKYGYRQIQHALNEEIEVWNGYQWSTVMPEVTGFSQDMSRISFNDGSELRCTKYHKFILDDGTRVKAKDLKEGDRLTKHNWPVIEGDMQYAEMYRQGFFSGDGWTTGNRSYIGLYGEKKKLANLMAYKTCKEYNITGGYEGTDTTETKLYLYLGTDLRFSKTFVPPIDWTLRCRLDWLAGLMDSDGCTVCSENSISVQVSSKDRDFLHHVKRMLNCMGTTGTLAPMKDCWRLSISSSNLKVLQELGLVTYRLDLSGNDPQRDASRFVTVNNIEDDGRCAVVYCFNEPENHSGIFGGVLTAQCGEQPLPPYGACLLGSSNLTKYVKVDNNGKRYFDFGQFKNDIPVIVRAMDNIVDRAIYPLPEQEEEARSKRRMGLGITGLANAGESLGLPYGTPRFVKFTESVMHMLTNEAYKASALLAKEKGVFPLYDKEKYLASKFIKTLDEDTQKLIARHGIRNSHLISIAPTGTISLAADNISSGGEPVFALTYNRTINTLRGTVVEEVSDYAFREWGVKGKTTVELTADDHLNVLMALQKYVDSAVSKTCNVDPNMPWDEFKEIYIKAWKGGCKGITTYNPEGKREGVLNVTEETEGAACWINPDGSKSCE